MSTFGSTTEDIDGVPIDRGPPEEMRMTEAELRGAMQDVAKAKKTMGELSTVEGIAAENKMMRSMMDDLCEQNNRLLGLYQTVRNELDTFTKQWNIERQSWIARNGGSTTPEDN
jgi:hypothetical protein